jgi:hypothetical protein
MSDFVDRWGEFWAAPDPSKLGTLAADDIVMRYPGVAEPLHGIDEWRTRAVSIIERFPDVRLVVTYHATVDDLCFISWQGFATADGVPITWEGTDRMIIKDDLVVDSMVAFDPAGFRPAVQV